MPDQLSKLIVYILVHAPGTELPATSPLCESGTFVATDGRTKQKGIWGYTVQRGSGIEGSR